MSPTTSCLNNNDVDSFLTGEFLSDQLSATEDHLTHCETCRTTIELAIGSQAWWEDVETSLRISNPQDSFNHESPDDECDRPVASQLVELLGPTDDPHMLGRIGTYEIVGILGRGGMGAVFKGFDRALNRFVAIKILLPHLAASGAARQRFAREAQAAAAVVDDHVMAIHCVDTWQEMPYFVMTYSRGVSLQKRLSEAGQLDLREILRIGMQAAKGLAAAHAQGLVHRDVKPANIFLDEGVERVQIMDFGLARAVDDASLTRSGVLAGTPQYMSPEQARAEAVDSQSDLFSLGSVLYAMCTGHPPFRAETSYGVLRLISDHEPRPIREVNPDVPEWLCALIARLMAKNKEQRYASSETVAELLEACLAHVQQPDSTPVPDELVVKTNGQRFQIFSRKGVIAMLGTIGAILLAGGIWGAIEAPDLSGNWSGDGWGNVILKQVEGKENQYSGSYVKTSFLNSVAEHPVHEQFQKFQCAACHADVPSGTIRVKWSNIEHRFKGTWSEGKERFGKISLRLVDDEIRGAWNASKKSTVNPKIPELADLVWKRHQETGTVKELEQDLADIVEMFNMLMEQGRFAEANALAKMTSKTYPQSPVLSNMKLKSSFAEQKNILDLPDSREGDFGDILEFRIRETQNGEKVHQISPPEPHQVIKALEEKLGLKSKSLTQLYEKHRNNFRIVVEPVYDKVDPPRFVPSIGAVRLHRVRFKCTVRFDETTEANWPVPYTVSEEITEVVYVDDDHLDKVDTENVASHPVLELLPENAEIHVVGCYASEQDFVNVNVLPHDNPRVIVLTSYFSVNWSLNISEHADVRAVIVAGYFEKGQLKGVPNDIPVISRHYYPVKKGITREEKKAKHDQCFHAWASEDTSYRKMLSVLENMTGQRPTTFQGDYTGKSFTIDGRRGRLELSESSVAPNSGVKTVIFSKPVDTQK